MSLRGQGSTAALKPARLALAGYFGCGNFGDEAVLSGLLNSLKGLNAEPLVLSGNPEQTAKRYNVRTVPRMAFAAIKQALKECDALILGGGSLLQDVTSWRSLLYYLYLIRLGKRFTGRVILTGQGIGPLKRALSRRLVRAALNRADAVAVRDADSLQLLEEIGVKTRLELTADMAWLMEADYEGAARLLKENAINPNLPLVALAPRPWATHSPQDLAAIFAALASDLQAKGLSPVGLAMDRENDGALWEMIRSINPEVPVIDGIERPEQLLGLMHNVQYAVAMRLHAALFAARAAVPTLTISYDPKVSSLAALLNLPSREITPEMKAEHLINAFTNLQAEETALRHSLAGARDAQIAKARRNIELIRDLVPEIS